MNLYFLIILILKNLSDDEIGYSYYISDIL